MLPLAAARGAQAPAHGHCERSGRSGPGGGTAMLTIGGEPVLTIDSDAHVIESEQTWSYLAPSEEQWRPLLFGSPADPVRQYWVIEEKIRGLRFPNLGAQALAELSERTGRDMNTDQGTREMATA